MDGYVFVFYQNMVYNREDDLVIWNNKIIFSHKTEDLKTTNKILEDKGVKIIDIEITNSEQLIDITDNVQDYITETRLKDGFVHIQIPERTSAVTISVNDDWRLEREFFKKVNHIMPKYDGMMFAGWTTTNVKASMFGMTIQIMVQDGTLILDKNQSIYFIEFHGPGKRQFYMTTMGTTLAEGEESSMPESLQTLHEKRLEAQDEQKRIQEEMRNEWRLSEEKRLAAVQEELE